MRTTLSKQRETHRNIETYNIENQHVVLYCSNKFRFRAANKKGSQQTSKLCGFGCGCPLPPDVFPSQTHCCLQIQPALKGLCLELYSRGHTVSNLLIASIFSLPPFCVVIHLGLHLLSAVRGLIFFLTSRPMLLQQIVR